MKPKVLVTCPLPGEAVNRLQEIADVELYEEGKIYSKAELQQSLADKVAAVTLLVDQIDDEIMASAPHLKVIANYAVGYNNIDVPAATKRGILVTNTPDVLTESTADLAWALMLAAARRVPEGDKLVRDGKFTGWTPVLLLGRTVYDKTLGVFGMGRIGQAVAMRAKGFNMKVIYHNRSRLPIEIEKKLNAEYVSFEELLTQADYISLHAPLTEDSFHCIGEAELRKMKKTAYLINTSRGPLVDEKALVEALKNHEIAGAGLDVFEREPEIEAGLDQLTNAVLAPHIGSATIETRIEMANLAVENVMAVLNGKSPLTPVNAQGLES